jgi:hypothetical protein
MRISLHANYLAWEEHMKRRILDLIKQTEFSKPEGIQHDGTYVASLEDLHRFAELIIQECAVELESNRMAVYDANQHHEYWNCGVKWSVAKLKDHFAVKLKYLECES